MDAYDPLRDYDTQPSWSPITPTSPTRKLEFPDQTAFDVHAFVDNGHAEEKLHASVGNALADEKPTTIDVSKLNTLDSSIEQIKSGIKAGPAEPDPELLHIWAEVRKALRNQLKEELRTELQNDTREELKEEVGRELQDELLKETQHRQSAGDIQGMVKLEEETQAQQLFDPFAPVLLGPIRPGFEDGDARAIAELNEAMKEVDERMARMDEERERGFEEAKG
ncbi:MAG: hypothetical protein OHK93_007890 [Ramalina farinacea]|uniref:Uncharacterized protein n=1 Tax=Ramalina farinacea TaxID=258253 RepID=A0AA43QQM7_9LECA|nr:hypothetical protein [Ramalina farinacea]